MVPHLTSQMGSSGRCDMAIYSSTQETCEGGITKRPLNHKGVVRGKVGVMSCLSLGGGSRFCDLEL